MKKLFLIASFVTSLSADQPAPTTSPVIETTQKEPSKTEAIANLVKEPKKETLPIVTIPIMEKPDNKDIDEAGSINFTFNSSNEKPQDRVLDKVAKDHLIETRAMMGKYTCKD
jgi:hypothetical protein